MIKVPKISVVIVGISGYAGLELARLLLRHSFVHLKAGYTSQGDFQLSDALAEEGAAKVPVFPLDPNPMDKSENSLLSFAKQGNLVFLATPAEVSSKWAPKLIQLRCNVIDLSGAFRLSSASAKKWYGAPEETDGEFHRLLAQAEYGLIPWIGPSQTGSSVRGRLVANPGCYSTCTLMALLPLLQDGLIDPDSLVIDAKSGTTGAGRKAAQNLLFSEVEGECLPYKVGQHQHYPEICEYADKLAATKIEPFFTTHLLSIRRGMIASIYAKTSQNSGTVTLDKITSCYEKAYKDYPLAKALALDSRSAYGLSLKRVVGSARVEIRFHLSGNKLTVFSLIDNLMKGAATQAVENMNLIFDYPLTTGLTELEGLL
ncbi:MAG: N-acetyl-gamma-glutamyl-phosphate reductase [Bdellovibrionia bacterium]